MFPQTNPFSPMRIFLIPALSGPSASSATSWAALVVGVGVPLAAAETERSTSSRMSRTEYPLVISYSYGKRLIAR